MSDKPNMLQAALEYARKGYHIFPCHEPLFNNSKGLLCSCERWRHSDDCKRKRPDLYLEPDRHCDRPGKHPWGVEHGKDDATTDAAQILAWWKKHPNANIGCVPGRAGYAVLDADAYKDAYAGADMLTDAEQETPTALSGGGGAHLWYRKHVGATYSNAPGTLPAGVDVRADGGYVVLPPSMHSSGRRYTWELGYGLDEIEAQPLPQRIHDVLIAATAKAGAAKAQFNGEPTTEPPDLDAWRVAPEIYKLITEGAPQGSDRSKLDAKVCTALLYAGADADDILAVFEHYPIGKNGKFAERGRDYLAMTIGKACQYVTDNPPTNGAGYADGYTRQHPDPASIGHRGPRLPSIDPRQQLRTLRDAALQAIIGANERTPAHPVLLVRGGALVRLKTNEDGRTVAEPVTNGALLNILANVADWEKVNEDEDGKQTDTPAHPPQNVVTALLNAGEWPGLPVLEGIVYAPTFTRDGTLHTAPGYDARTRLYNAGNVQLGDTTPTAATVQAALALFYGDLVVDFPFADNASRAHALALYLLPFVRRMIDGPTVMHMASAPAAGTGKSLLISMALLPALGELPEPITSSPDPNEMDKVLTAKVLEGAPYLFIDNISGKLDSASLASALTQTRFNRRLLGTNATVSGKVDWVWAGTANNPGISDELTRRSVLIRLDAGMEQPDRRSGFKHSDIAAWAKAHRDALVTAAVTLVRNWQENAAGRRWRERAKGSFEQWAEIMGGILDAAGVPGFLANDDELRAQAAPETADLRAFVAAWAARFGQSPVTVKMLMPLASTIESVEQDANGKPAMVQDGDDLLGALLGNGNARSRETRLGLLLNDHKDRVFGEWRIMEGKRDSHNKNRTWIVQPARTGGDSAERCGTLRNVANAENANVPQLSTTGEIGFREVLRNVAEPFGESNTRAEKTPATEADTDVSAGTPARVCIVDSPKGSATFRNVSQKAQSPEVDSCGTLAQVEGQRFRNVPQKGGNVPQNGGLDAYLDRDLTQAEFEAARQAAYAAGLDVQPQPLGGWMWRISVRAPEPAGGGDDVIAGL